MTELIINGFNLDLSDDIVIPLTFSIADIKDPSKRKQSFSKSINVIGTKRNMSFFRSAWSLTISDVDGSGLGINYDPLLKYNAVIRKDDVTLFDGWAYLREIKIEQEVYHFTINVFSNMVGFYDTLGNLKISELGWSSYNFTLSVANVRARQISSTGLGIIYPNVNYGFTNSLTKYKTNELFPHIHFYEILKKIFEYLNIIWDSNFLETAIFKKIIIGHGGGTLPELSPTEVGNREVSYEFDGVQTREFIATAVTPFISEINQTYYLNVDSANFTDTVITDTYNQYDVDWGIIQIANSGSYLLNIDCPLEITFTALSLTNLTFVKLNVSCLIMRNGTLVNSESQEFYVENTLGSTTTLTYSLEQELYLNANDEVSVLFEIVVNAQNTILFQLEVETDVNTNLDIQLTAINPVLVDGDTVVISSLLPDMTCARFLKDIITMFNLYIDETENPNEYRIEPHDEFYNGTADAEDYSDLVDYSKEIKIQPSGMIEGKIYNFKYTTDLDHYKQKYFNEWGKQYGDYEFRVPTNYQIGIKDYEVVFAMSVPVEVAGTDLIFPFIVQENDAGFLTPYKGKPRVYFNNGLVASDTWTLINSDTLAETNYNSYLQVHHLDSLSSPTLDLCFGTVERVYYTATTYTTQNIFMEFWNTFIREITGRDSKLVTMSLKLNERYIYKGMMADLVNIEGVIYKKNIIKDFQVNNFQTTEMELIKVLGGRTPRIRTPFVPLLEVGDVYNPVMKVINNGDNATYEVQANESLIIGVPTTGNTTVNIDPTALIIGQKYTVKNSAGIRGMILTPTSGTIDGGATFNISAGRTATFISDGINLYVI